MYFCLGDLEYDSGEEKFFGDQHELLLSRQKISEAYSNFSNDLRLLHGLYRFNIHLHLARNSVYQVFFERKYEI